MGQYISKAAVVAEIEKLEEVLSDPLMKVNGADYVNGGKKIIKELKSFLDTLEVKGVDLETEQRIKDCPFRTAYCERFEGAIVECDGRCSWVVDYPKLKELKAQKRENI